MTTPSMLLCWLGIFLSCLGLGLILIGFGPSMLLFSGAGVACSCLAILAEWRR